MTRIALLAVAAPLVLLSACGPEGSSAPAAPARPVHVLTDAEKATLLAALPAA